MINAKFEAGRGDFMTFVFREIQKEDYTSCADSLIAAYANEPWNNPWTLEEALLRIEATMSGFNARGYVIEYEGHIIAMCLGRIDYYFQNWRQFCIDEFNVTPHYQRQGIGRQLFAFAATQLKKEAIQQLFLLTGGAQAVTFYEKNGFLTSNEGTMMVYPLTEA